MLREKYASRVEELDLVQVELAELKSRPALLGACTSCPVLHAKLNESLEHAKSLESALKSSAATTCSTCDAMVLNNHKLEKSLSDIEGLRWRPERGE